MKPRELKFGDVVQIGHNGSFFADCLMVVTDPKPWGAQGYVSVPQNGGPKQAYYRAGWDDMEYVGTASWVAK